MRSIGMPELLVILVIVVVVVLAVVSGHGSGAHAPNEYYVIESTNPKIQGYDGAVRSFVESLAELAVSG